MTLSAPGRTRVPLLILPAAVVAVFFLFYGWAVLTGHWHSTIGPETIKAIYSTISLEKLAHP